MEKSGLIEQMKQKEELLRRTEIIFHQLQGQIELLRSLIKIEDSKNEQKEETK